LKQGDQGLIKA